MSYDIRCCPECNEPVHGRKDKKFCNASCRTAFHNKSKEQDPPEFARIKDSLIRNRRVLKLLYMSGMRRTTNRKLGNLEFSFEHYTGYTKLYRSKKIIKYFDFGLLIDEDEIRILSSSEMEELISSSAH